MQRTGRPILLDYATYPWVLLRRTSDDAAGIFLAILIGLGAGFGAYLFWKSIEWFSWLFFNRGGGAWTSWGIIM